MKKVWIVTGMVLIVLVVGAACFWGGMSYGKSRAQEDLMARAREGMGGMGYQSPGGGGMGQGRAGGGQGREGAYSQGQGTMGTIEAIEGNTLVLSSNDGIVRVATTDTTLVEKMTSVEVDALDIGTMVVMIGSRNEDGTITARSVQSIQGRGFMQPSGGQ